MQLYSFFRSGTSHRVRIALNLKGVAYEYQAVDLRTEQHLDGSYKAIQPQGLVPALVLDDGRLQLGRCPRGNVLQGQGPRVPVEARSTLYDVQVAHWLLRAAKGAALSARTRSSAPSIRCLAQSSRIRILSVLLGCDVRTSLVTADDLALRTWRRWDVVRLGVPCAVFA